MCIRDRQQIDGNIIGPKILGDSTGLSAFWVIFAITIFGSLMGPLGMFIGVPLFAVIYSLVRQFAEWRLSQKGLPTATDDYASKEHPIDVYKRQGLLVSPISLIDFKSFFLILRHSTDWAL